jgi:succinyl-diaminopimelate desuccinylase
MDVLTLTQELIEIPSVTPHDAGCQKVIQKYLSELGFKTVDLPSGPVSNLWAQYGTEAPLFVFAGHTDVVPVGELKQWKFDPFKPTIHEGYLYGRGAQDMKSGIAAMMVAVEHFLKKHPKFNGSIGFLITSGEEGDEYQHGTPVVIDYLKSQNKTMTWCVVGEPSSEKVSGDTVRNGRRGSVHAHLTVHGIQGHVAYPERADNPIHRALPALTELTQEQWDNGDEYFRPTSMQISNINAGTGAANVIPADLQLRFNFRNSPESSSSSLEKRTEAILDQHDLKYSIQWHVSGDPFITKPGKLIEATNKAVMKSVQIKPSLNTGGGTSDARFIAPTGCEVVELGVPGDTIHQINEKIRVEDLTKMVTIYETLLEELLLTH